MKQITTLRTVRVNFADGSRVIVGNFTSANDARAFWLRVLRSTLNCIVDQPQIKGSEVVTSSPEAFTNYYAI